MQVSGTLSHSWLAIVCDVLFLCKPKRGLNVHSRISEVRVSSDSQASETEGEKSIEVWLESSLASHMYWNHL